MKKLIIIGIVGTILLIVGNITYYYFKEKEPVKKEQNYGYSLKPKTITNMQKDTLTAAQADSLITSDSLPSMASWKQTTIKEDGSNSYYIYSTYFSKKRNTIYSAKALPEQDKVIMQKRKIVF